MMLDNSLSVPSSLSQVFIQAQLHKERLERIKACAYSPPLRHLPHYASIPDVIMFRVCDRYHVTMDDILSQRRRYNIVKARHAAIMMLDKFTRWTAASIARKLNRDLSTVSWVLRNQEQKPTDFSELECQIKATIPLIDSHAAA